MFEKLLESILSTYLGRFIEGFDQNNLKVGVWSGNVQIENVSLKQQAVQMLDLPFRIKASTIGKLTLKVPWKKLSR
jgi:vacuolar protein sorting-associated protein 13A/C